MENNNSLIKIERSDWKELRDLFADRKIYSCSFNLLQTLIDWINLNPDLPIEIYSLNGSWKSDGIFLVNVNESFIIIADIAIILQIK